jgi:predicted phage tail protein
MTIRGAGGGSEPKQHTPTESPDSLVSIAYARIVDLISEGEIFGLVNGAESIFLDGTPLISDGVQNFSNVTYEIRHGTQDQTYIPGFAQVENEISVGTKVTVPIPYVRTITNTDLSALRLNLNVPRMVKQDLENGDLTGYVVYYAIDLAIGSGPFAEVKTTSFNGKTTNGYNRSERIDLPPGSPDGWRVRIRRLTADSTTSNITDEFYVQSVTEIIDAKFRYPNSAIVATQFNAETFGGKVPVRSFEMWGRYMRVPSNYDTVTRQYDGIWDGTFKIAEKCNNPAWVYYDLILNEFFGLGSLIDASQIDKWGLYQIAQYCDQQVDDGKGGLEPRFTLNIYIQQRVDALRLLQDISSVFRGITYWGAGQAYVSADMPSDPVYTYTNANVLGGKFAYKGGRRSTRYTVAHVSWNDPDDGYKTKTEYVENKDAVGRFGIRPVSMAAFGCTSQGQAIRAGKWALLTNLLETESVAFSVGLDGVRARPGQVIKIADNDRAGRRIGGRITAATINSVTVDKAGTFLQGDELTVVTPDFESQTRIIESVVGNLITVTDDFTAVPLRMSPFAVDSAELATQTFRIISISEAGDLNYQISAVKHVPGKYGNVDYGIVISQRPITAIPTTTQAPVTGIVVTSEYLVDQYAAVSKLLVSWVAPVGAVSYEVEWSRDSSDWIYAGRVSTTEIEVQGIFAGEYRVRVKAVNSMGIMSIWTQAGPFDLQGKPDNTAEVINLRTESQIFAIRVRWDVPETARDTAYTELMYNTTNSDTGATTLGQIGYPTLEYLHAGMGAGVVLWFKARLIDKTGNAGPWSDWESGQSSSDATDILDYLTGEINETHLGTELSSEIEKISGNGPGSVNDRINDLETDVNQQIENLQTQLNEITDAPDWVLTNAYNQGDLVNHDGRLYSAIQNVPANTPITDTDYWQDIGAYSNLGEAVASLNVRMDDAETNIDAVTGLATATASSVSALRSIYRDDDGEGELADALDGYDSKAQFVQEVRTRATQNEAMVIRTTQLEAETAAGAARMTEIEATIVENDTATTARLNEQESMIGSNTAAISSEASTRASADSAMASNITTIQTTVNGHTVSIQTNATSINNINGSLAAMYSIKVGIDSNGRYYSAGMGIGVENTPSGMQSQVLFLADRFAVMHAINGTPQSVFAIQGGQTFLDTAIIQNASITFAKISDSLQSDNYVANTSGWRLSKAGGIEINANVPGQGRLQITNQLIQIWDSSNVLRVRLGIWS